METDYSSGDKVFRNKILLTSILKNCDTPTLLVLRTLNTYCRHAVTSFNGIANPISISLYLSSKKFRENNNLTWITPSLARSIVMDLSYDKELDQTFPEQISDFLNKYQQFIEDLKVTERSQGNETIPFIDACWDRFEFPRLKTLEYTDAPLTQNTNPPSKTVTEIIESEQAGKHYLARLIVSVPTWTSLKFFQFFHTFINDCPNVKDLQLTADLDGFPTLCQNWPNLKNLELYNTEGRLPWLMTFPDDFKGFPFLKSLRIFCSSMVQTFLLGRGEGVIFPVLEILEIDTLPFNLRQHGRLAPVRIQVRDKSKEFPKLKRLKANTNTNLISTNWSNLLNVESLEVLVGFESNIEMVERFLPLCTKLKKLSLLPNVDRFSEYPNFALKLLNSLKSLRGCGCLSELEVCVFHPAQSLQNMSVEEELEMVRSIAHAGLESLIIHTAFEDGIGGDVLNQVSNLYLNMFPALENVRRICLKGNAVLGRIKPFLQKELHARNIEVEFEVSL